MYLCSNIVLVWDKIMCPSFLCYWISSIHVVTILYISSGSFVFSVFPLFNLFWVIIINLRNTCTCRVLAAAAKRAGHEDEGSLPSLHTSILMFQSLGFFAVKLFYFASFLLLGSNATSENGVDNKKDLLMPDLCVICLEQEYNSVFVP